MGSHSLAIIIVAYKSEQMTINFIKTELTKIKLGYKIIIVNNEATIESNNIYKNNLNACLVVDYKDFVQGDNNSVYVINNPKNSGFAIANNMAAKFAERNFNSNYFLFTNNDIRFVDGDVVEKLIAKLEQHPEVGIIGPMVRGLKDDYQSPEPYMSFAERFIWMYLSTPFISKEEKRKRFKLDYSKNAKEGYHYKVMGSFFMIPSKYYFDCGMMDEHTFLFAEEMILSERMAAIDKKVYYDPEVCVIHAHGITMKKNFKSKKMNNILFDSNAYYYHHYKHVSKFEIFIGRIVKNLMYVLKNRTPKYAL